MQDIVEPDYEEQKNIMELILIEDFIRSLISKIYELEECFTLSKNRLEVFPWNPRHKTDFMKYKILLETKRKEEKDVTKEVLEYLNSSEELSKHLDNKTFPILTALFEGEM